jgi:iron complex outermembrane receptor protein
MLERLGSRSAGLVASRAGARDGRAGHLIGRGGRGLAGVACALLLASPASAADDSARLQGRVFDATGAAVSGATVVVQSGAVGRETVTDAEGRFAFESLPPGKSTLRVVLSGFEPAQIALTLLPGSNQAGELRLRPGRAEEVTVRGYVTAASTRTDTPLSEIPQAIAVIPRAVLEEQTVVRLNEAVTNASGVVRAYGLGGTNESVAIRGFPPDSIYNNGTPARAYVGFEEPANVERLEVVKGPNSMLYGQGQLAGFVNMVTKRPLGLRKHEVELTAGSDEFFKGSFDITGPFDSGRTVLYRLVTAYENSKSFRDLIEADRFFIAPSLTWRPGGTTSLTLYTEVSRQDRGYDFGIPLVRGVVPDVPLDFYYGESWSKVRGDFTRVGYEFTQGLGGGGQWSLRSTFRYQSSEEEDVFVLPATGAAVSRDPQVLNRITTFLYLPTETADLYLNVLGKVGTGNVTHDLLFGTDVYWLSNGFQFASGPVPPPIRIFEPVHTSIVPAIPQADTDTPRSTTTQLGFYFQDQLGFGRRVKLLLGGRYSRERGSQLFRIADDEAFTPRAGVVFLPSESVSVYGSYSTSYQSNSSFGRSASGEPFEPLRGKQFEGGIKADLVGGRLTLTTAVYDLRRKNVPAPDPDRPGFSLTIGEEAAKGFEIDLTARPADGWRVMANYAFTDTEIVRASPATQGKQLPNFPRHAGRLWLSYRVGSGGWQGLGVGAGLTAQGKRQGNNTNTFTLDGFTVADVSVFLDRPRFRVGVTLKNIFDERHFVLGGPFGPAAIPGAPRSVLASLAVRP